MKIKITAHIKQHAGDVLFECQDSFDYNLDNFSFAVSDGVSQAYRPELWSRILTKVFVIFPDSFFVSNDEGKYVINPSLGLCSKWAEEEENAYKNASPQEKFILDMKKNSINISAATFIGVKLKKEGVAYHTIGDSVLFFFDYETKELTAYSSMMPESGEMVFNNSPEYIDSNECNHGIVASGILPYRKGILFMATDALSDWIVERKASSKVVETILLDMMSITSHEDYDSFVDSARNNENPTKLKDDDTTFIALEFTDIDDEKLEIEKKYAEKYDDLCIKNLILELNKTKNELEVQKSARSKSDLALRNKERQIIKLTKELESAKEKETENSKLKSEIQKLTDRINKLQGDLSSLKTTIESLTSDNQRLKSENQRFNTDNKKLTIENKQLKKLSNTTNVKDEDIANLKDLLSKSKENERKVNKQLETLKSAIKEIKGSISLSPADLHDHFPFLNNDFGGSAGVQVTEIKIGTPREDGGFEI